MLWTVGHQVPLSMGSSRQEHWSGLPFPPSGDLLDPGTEPASLVAPTLAGWIFTIKPPGKPLTGQVLYKYIVTILCSSLFKIFTKWMYIESIKGSLVYTSYCHWIHLEVQRLFPHLHPRRKKWGKYWSSKEKINLLMNWPDRKNSKLLWCVNNSFTLPHSNKA